MAEEMMDNVPQDTQTDVAGTPDVGQAPALDEQQTEAAQDFEAAPWTDELPESLRGDVEGLTSMEDFKAALKRGMEYRPATDIEQLVTTAPDGVTIDEGVNRAFRELGVKIGLTQAQAQEIVNFEVSQMAAAEQAAIDAGTEALRKQWGPSFETKSAKATQAMLALDQRMGGRLSAALGEGGLANSPTLIEAFATLGELISEDSLAGSTSGSSGQMPQESAVDMYRSMGFRG